MQDQDILKVSGSSNPTSLASALAHAVYAGQKPVMRAIGAAAVNQAVKAATIASGFAATRGVTLLYQFGFDEVVGNSNEMISCVTIRAVPT